MISAQWRPGNGEVIGRLRTAGAEAVARAAVYLHAKLLEALSVPNPGVRQGRRTVYPNTSLPGQPPRLRTGWLRANVLYELDLSAGRARVGLGANAPYGLYLELGTRRMAPRPWLVATLTRVMPQLQAILKHGGAA